ncbi:olfactory receptor 11G2-like [Heteronotia binoei]|uniref:olfactory receptor 11G2-like n=1 Tax=Heteronotia binoei TaxID=13085 RepID=UPI00293137AB|nr:olfactory receptor 11G2-like [Heteronotia binoei]
METANRTEVREFILVGFRVGQQERLLLLIFFTILYLFAVAENLTIILLVFLDTHLAQLPMYILLSNFSWLEICYLSSIVPRMLFDLPSPHRVISFHSCFLQFYFFFSCGNTECFFLSAMALDRYLAICHPLRYPQLMSKDSCYTLVVACWVGGLLWYLFPVVLISKMSFCGSNIIDHFLCDPGPILSLACPPLGITPYIFQVFMNTVCVGNVLFIVLSYGNVIFTLMKTSNRGSRKKGFSTISMHLVVVTIFYGSGSGMYLSAGSENPTEVTKAITLFYTSITPSLNPMIYCLRNDQVKEALGNLRRTMILPRRKVLV